MYEFDFYIHQFFVTYAIKIAVSSRFVFFSTLQTFYIYNLNKWCPMAWHVSERKKYDSRNWKLYIISMSSFDASHPSIIQEESEYRYKWQNCIISCQLLKLVAFYYTLRISMSMSKDDSNDSETSLFLLHVFSDFTEK